MITAPAYHSGSLTKIPVRPAGFFGESLNNKNLFAKFALYSDFRLRLGCVTPVKYNKKAARIQKNIVVEKTN